MAGVRNGIGTRLCWSDGDGIIGALVFDVLVDEAGFCILNGSFPSVVPRVYDPLVLREHVLFVHAARSCRCSGGGRVAGLVLVLRPIPWGRVRDRIFLQFLPGRIASAPMSSQFGVPQIRKWPFVVGDLLLIGVAVWIFYTNDYAPAGGDLGMIVACLGLGVFISVLPFMAEFREESRRFDANEFRSTLDQIRQLEGVGDRLDAVTAQWEAVQENCGQVVQAAADLSAKNEAEVERWQRMAQQADTRERDHLRLEVEKLRRGEREWLEVLVGILDHIFALHRAAVQSRQVKLIGQIEAFRNACLEISRRVGLSQYLIDPGEAYNPEIHKIPEGSPCPENPVVAETLAPGFSFQGHAVRQPMVALVDRSLMGSKGADASGETAKDDPDLFDQVDAEGNADTDGEQKASD